MNPRHKPLVYVLLCLAGAWLVAGTGYLIARGTRVTAEKVRAYLHRVDLARLQGEARAKALRDLARQLNALSYEERRAARLDREWLRWMTAMTDAEKVEFIEATLPSGFRQMLTAFEQLPPERRRKTVDDALKRLREAQAELGEGEPGRPPEWGTNAPPVLSEEVRQKVITTGLKSFYSESTAQTKAEAAPLLEELQRMMERGAFLRGR